MTPENTTALLSVACLAQFILIVIQWSAIRGWKDTVEHLAGCLKRSREREDIWQQACRRQDEEIDRLSGGDPFACVGKQPASPAPADAGEAVCPQCDGIGAMWSIQRQQRIPCPGCQKFSLAPAVGEPAGDTGAGDVRSRLAALDREFREANPGTEEGS